MILRRDWKETFFWYIFKINTTVFTDRLNISVRKKERRMIPSAKWGCHTETRRKTGLGPTKIMTNTGFVILKHFLHFHTSHELNVSVFYPTFNNTHYYYCLHSLRVLRILLQKRLLVFSSLMHRFCAAHRKFISSVFFCFPIFLTAL